MKKLIVIAFLTFSVAASGAGTVDFFKIENEILYFSTNESKLVSSPACHNELNDKLFTVSTNTASGRALYSLLMSAITTKLPIEIESAQDCSDIDGFERAKSVAISPEAYSFKAKLKNTILNKVLEIKTGESVKLYDEVHWNTYNFYKKNATQNTALEKDNVEGAWREIISGDRTLLGGAEGSGWLTAIVLPELSTKGINTTVEVIVDGESVVYDLTKKSVHKTRYYFGLLQERAENDYFYKVPRAGVVVSKGVGVPFKQSVEVWVTMNEVASGYDRMGAIQVIFGETFN